MARRRTAREQGRLVVGNRLYNGDNLAVLREGEVPPDSVDLIYLDPPWNKKRNFNVIFKELSGLRPTVQQEAFKDNWEWNQRAMNAFHDTLETAPPKVVDRMLGFRSTIGESDVLAYLSMMAPRLVEMHKVLKPTGSIYLHCDPTASHYLKLLMDAVFGPEHFQNEVIWYYRGGGVSKTRWGRRHDTLFFYSKSEKWTFNIDDVRTPYSQESLARLQYKAKSFRGNKVYENYEPNPLGKHPDDVWEIQPVMPSAKEQLPWPTQKPVRLLERVILASSNPDDIVLDPFCGCGTTVAVAQKLGRRWIGIDHSMFATDVIQKRLADVYGEDVKKTYEFIPKPVTAQDARKLKGLPFEWWAVEKAGAQPSTKRGGGDSGIDGRIYFREVSGAGKIEAKQVILSVKSGKVFPRDVRELRGVIERENAAIGVLIVMNEPTKEMEKEAATAGRYYSETWEVSYPRLQIVTVDDLMKEKPIDYPGRLPGIAEKAAAQVRTAKGSKKKQAAAKKPTRQRSTGRRT